MLDNAVTPNRSAAARSPKGAFRMRSEERSERGARAWFRRPRAGGSETRPAGHVAGLPGAGCPGSGSVVRYHEARDRTELKAARPSARAAVERRKASASPKRGARRDAQPKRRSACCANAATTSAPFGAPPPLSLFGGKAFVPCSKTRAPTKRAARTGFLCAVATV